MATGRIYHYQFLDSQIVLSKETLGFLPTHALVIISQDFSRWSPSGLRFNNVLDRSNHPNNTADAVELVAIDYFRNNPGS
jgi:hypothetical protein